MSLAEIIEELPKLTVTERRELELHLFELEPHREQIDLCDHLSLEAVQVLDRLEDNASQSS